MKRKYNSRYEGTLRAVALEPWNPPDFGPFEPLELEFEPLELEFEPLELPDLDLPMPDLEALALELGPMPGIDD